LMSQDCEDGCATRSAGACAACRAVSRYTRDFEAYLNGASQGPLVLSLSKEDPRTPGFRLVEPTARREGRPYPWARQGAIHKTSGLDAMHSVKRCRASPVCLNPLLKGDEM